LLVLAASLLKGPWQSRPISLETAVVFVDGVGCGAELVLGASAAAAIAAAVVLEVAVGDDRAAGVGPTVGTRVARSPTVDMEGCTGVDIGVEV
jgi:hypothetical protein